MSGEEISEGGERKRQDRNGEWEGKEGGMEKGRGKKFEMFWSGTGLVKLFSID